MAPVLDATLKGENANSYADKTFADAYAANQWWGDTWAGLSEDAQAIAMITATKWHETLPFAGTRCTATQALQWPRSGATCDGITSDCAGIPRQIKVTEMELAFRLSQDPDAITGPPGGGGAVAGTYVKREKLGELEREMAEFSSADSSCDNCGDPALISKYPWIEDLLGCWLGSSFGSSKILLRVRS